MYRFKILGGVVLWTDIGAFTEALDEDHLEDAVASYAGPFLDGFFLSEAVEFERWVEDERARIGARNAAT